MTTLLLLAPLPPFLQEPLEANYRCIFGRDQVELEAALREHGEEIQGIVGTGGSVVSAEMLERLTKLGIIAVNGVGYDRVEIDACKARGVRVTNTPDVLTADVADLAVALVLMTSRNLIRANRDLCAGEWAAGATRLTQSLHGKRAGIVGLGRIGKAIAERLGPFGLEVGYFGRSWQEVEYQFFADLRQLAAWADFLVVACPGGSSTRLLIDEAVLTALGSKGILINIARGSVVDEAALIRVLAEGQLAGAGLDVFENEPVVPPELLAHPNVVLLPHVGSATRETRGAMADLVLRNLAAHFSGKELITPVI